MNDILEAREARSNHIQRLMEEYPNKTVVILKANVVGREKNPRHMRFICAFFHAMMQRTFGAKIVAMEKIESRDGNYCYFVIKENGLVVKARTIEIEEYNNLGRLIDLDVYDKKSISREELSCEMRKCLICDHYAHLCARNKTHSEDEINAKVKSIIDSFLVDYLTNVTIKAIFSELELYPKAGLVSHRDPGCHTDMDYETFVHSTFAIKHDIEDYIKEGCQLDANPNRLVEIGKQAEYHMYQETGGINTQKGLIFLLGLFLPALTETILEHKDETYLKTRIQAFANAIVGDYYDRLTAENASSNGDHIYLQYGLKGVRGEALNGLEPIFAIPTSVHYDDDITHHQYLVELMSRLDDTTIVQKTNLTTLRQVQQDMKNILHEGGYLPNQGLFQILSNQYKIKGISPGGSADMLVLKIIYEDVRHLLAQT
jgi:holo-ACP synthase CitX